MVIQAGKTGFLYVFDRDTGEPIWPIEERPVPPSDVPGEEAWPTQPFPTVVPPFTPQTLTPDDVNPYVLTPEEREEWRERIAGARNLGLFTPPAVGVDTVAIPGAQGGANWGTTAAHPTNGTFYVLGISVPSIYRLLRGIGTSPSLIDLSMRIGPETLREIITGGRLAMPPILLATGDMASLLALPASPNPSAVPATPLADSDSAADRGPVVASGGAPGARAGGDVARGGMVGPAYPENLPVPSVRYYTDYGMQASLVKPPYSTLTAYDLNTASIKWQIPAGGDDPRAVAEGATNTGYPRLRTGIITTSTGLLFQAGLDGRVDGQQYLVVSATQSPNPARGGAPVGGELRGQRAYVAFALPR